MTLQVLFKSRAYGYEPQPAALDFAVQSFSKDAIGGPNECQINVQGGDNQLAQLTEYLGKPIEIYDEIGRAAWWGRVHEIQFNTGGMAYGWTLGQMANRVQVVYTEVASNSDTGYGTATEWANDLTSQSLYGTVELRYSTGNGNGAAATALRDRILAERGMPVAVLINSGQTSEGAAIYGQGWFRTLGNCYGSVSVLGITGFTGAVVDNQTLGSAAANTAYDRQVLIAQTINIGTVSLWLRKVGAPTDNVLVDVAYLDPTNGAPTNTYYTTGTLDGATLGTAYAWANIPLGATVTPTAAAYDGKTNLIGLSIRRSAAVNTTNFYQIGIGSEGITGTLTTPLTPSLYDGATWALQYAQAGTLALYKLNTENSITTSAQAADLARTYGQNFIAAVINDAAGYTMPSYKSGDVSALQAIENLFKVGESGGNRLLCNVDINRTMRIYEEPDNTTVGYYMDKNGIFTDSSGAIIPGCLVEPGKWIKAKDIYPWFQNSQLGDAALFMAETVNYNADGRVDISPRTMPGEYDINPLSEVT